MQRPNFNEPSDYLENDLLVKPVTLSNIIEMTEKCDYVNSDDFLLHFKWLLHNITILAQQSNGND